MCSTNTLVYVQILQSESKLTRLLYTIYFLFSAGYNNVEVAEFLLENGADVNAQDKGGLIPYTMPHHMGYVYLILAVVNM